MLNARRTAAALIVATLVAGCAPADGSPPDPPSHPPPATTAASPSGSAASPSPTPEATPSLPVEFPLSSSLLDGGAARVVQRLHKVSGLRPALKLDISKDEVILTVLSVDLQARSYRWRDGIIEPAETDVQYLHQTTFWPTDFALNNVRRILDVSALMGTSGENQMLQVVEYAPGQVFMSVSSTPETITVFFRKDATAFLNLDTRSVAGIREGISAVTSRHRSVFLIGFDDQRGFYAEMPGRDDTIERRSRMQNRPTFTSQRTGTSALTPFSPGLVDAAALAQTIALHDPSGKGCSVEIDNRFERVQPVVTYQCDGNTFHSDLRGTDLTAQLR